ncbi:MAG: hypothetical protein Ta2D_10780 [Rickettsiales bacterium]|nr:MAG: hypothetical protein Ta2D_10780 [Rickettsiales bacterium]
MVQYKKKTSILFTHTDLDGAGCAILFKTFLQVDYVYCIGHGLDNKIDKEIEKTMSKYNPSEVDVYIADISPNTTQMMEWLIKNCNSVVVLDHHKSQDFLLKYKQFNYSLEKCGTSLVRDYLQKKGLWEHKYLKDFDYFVDVINDIDLWLLQDPFSKDLNKLFSFMGMSKFIEALTDRPQMMYRYNDIIDILNNTEKNYIEKALEKKYPCACGGEYVFAENYGNEIGNNIAENNDDKIGIVINMKNKSVSLRSIGDIDISKIAIANGGGGHKNASGFAFETLDELDKFIKTGNIK